VIERSARFILKVKVGDSVSFVNKDPYFHNIFFFVGNEIVRSWVLLAGRLPQSDVR